MFISVVCVNKCATDDVRFTKGIPRQLLLFSQVSAETFHLKPCAPMVHLRRTCHLGSYARTKNPVITQV